VGWSSYLGFDGERKLQGGARAVWGVERKAGTSRSPSTVVDSARCERLHFSVAHSLRAHQNHLADFFTVYTDLLYWSWDVVRTV